MMETQKNSFILESLYEIGIALTSNLKIEEVLDQVGEQARKVLGADRASCHLYDSETGLYKLLSDIGVKVDKKLDRVPRIDGPTAWIVKHRNYLYSNNAQVDDTLFRDSPFTIAEDIKTVLGLPLKKGDDIVGVLYINYRKPNMITDEIIRISELIANQAAVAVYNAKLFRDLSKRENAMSRLVEVGSKISEAIARPQNITDDPGVKQVLKDIARTACELTGADCSVFYPFDASRKEFYDIEQVGAFGLNTDLKLKDKPRSEDGMAAYIHHAGFLKRENVSLEDPNMLASDFIDREGVQAFIGIDVCVDDDRLGVLYVNYRNPRIFTPEEENTIRHFANQAGVAIQIARIIEKEQKARSNLEILGLMNEIGGAFAHRVIGIMGTIPILARQIRGLVKKHNVEDIKIDEAITQIEEDSYRILEMAGTLRRLKEFQGRPQFVDINYLLVSIVTPKIKPPMMVKSELYNNIPQIHVPKQQVVEVIENIVDNAIEHMATDGTLSISTELLGNKWLAINITDTGSGLNKEKQQKIFNLFYGEKKGGLGFGLWWSRTFMRRLGGDIIVDSEKGKGSTFTVMFPRNLFKN